MRSDTNSLRRDNSYRKIIQTQFETIQRHRDTLYRLLAVLDYGMTIPATTVSNAEFSIEGEVLIEQLMATIEEAKRALEGEWR